MWRGWLVMAWVGCGGSASEVAADAVPVAIADAECAVCGMVVSEQPAPRGQLVHRDGQHKFTCSLGDLRAYLQTPSPLGKPTQVFVEVLPSGTEPQTVSSEPRPWLPAADASYVVGISRPGVMGVPILSFAAPEHSTPALTAQGARQTTWQILEEMSFNELPPETSR